MSADVATVLGSAFTAAILTTFASRWIAGFQAKKYAAHEELRRIHETEQARLADQRSLRDQKRERLRGDYETVAYAAEIIRGTVGAMAMLLSGDTPEARDERLKRRLDDATQGLARAIVRLRLEKGAAPLNSAYKELDSLWFAYQYELPDANAKHDHSELLITLTALEGKVAEIFEMAKDHLAGLELPI